MLDYRGIMFKRSSYRGLLICFLTVGLLAGCASSQKNRRDESLYPTVQQYNDMIRWRRADLAAPFVHPEAVKEYKDWSRDYVKNFEIQAWRIDHVEYASEETAHDDVQRVGFKVPRYVQEETVVEQVWTWIDEVGWRIREGF